MRWWAEVTDVPETLSVTFTYSTTRGVFTGHFSNGVTFDFIAAANAPLPTKLRNALQALMSRAHTQFKHSRAGRPEMSDEEWNALMDKVKGFEATHGVTRSKKKAVRTPRRANKIETIDIGGLEID